MRKKSILLLTFLFSKFIFSAELNEATQLAKIAKELTSITNLAIESTNNAMNIGFTRPEGENENNNDIEFISRKKVASNYNEVKEQIIKTYMTLFCLNVDTILKAKKKYLDKNMLKKIITSLVATRREIERRTREIIPSEDEYKNHIYRGFLNLANKNKELKKILNNKPCTLEEIKRKLPFEDLLEILGSKGIHISGINIKWIN